MAEAPAETTTAPSTSNTTKPPATGETPKQSTTDEAKTPSTGDTKPIESNKSSEVVIIKKMPGIDYSDFDPNDTSLDADLTPEEHAAYEELMKSQRDQDMKEKLKRKQNIDWGKIGQKKCNCRKRNGCSKNSICCIKKSKYI